jgi:segregation and condensation protein B
MNLEQKIESVLFWKGEPVSIKRLSEIFKCSNSEIESALGNLENQLQNRGICLVRKENEIMLGTAAALSDLIEKLTKEELSKDLGKAGLETLSVIIYKGPISRREIDFIRGVNSTFILRHLMVRGLVERVVNPKDERSFLYKPTFELLSYLGIKKIEEAPNYADVIAKLNQFKEEADKQVEKDE